MFTKYNNVTVPKNYSGNRFRSSAEEIPMKTHRADAISQSTGIKTSVSPFYHSLNEPLVEEKPSPNVDLSYYEENDLDINESVEITDTPSAKSDQSKSFPTSHFNGLDSLSKLFDNTSSDDLLLLSLILLLAGDDGKNRIDTITLLALLLMHH